MNERTTSLNNFINESDEYMSMKDIKGWLESVFKTSKIDHNIIGKTVYLTDDIHTIRLEIYGGNKILSENTNND